MHGNPESGLSFALLTSSPINHRKWFIKMFFPTQLILCWGYYNHTLRQVANLFNKVILCVQRYATMFVQVYANPFIGKQIMNIKKWEVWHVVVIVLMYWQIIPYHEIPYCEWKTALCPWISGAFCLWNVGHSHISNHLRAPRQDSTYTSTNWQTMIR